MSYRRRKAVPSLVALFIGLAVLLGAHQLLAWFARNEPRRPPTRVAGVFYMGDVDGANVWEAPPLLRVDSDVRRNWPRDSFGFRLQREGGFTIDTFSGQVTKDQGHDPDTTIALVIDNKELDWIYELALASRFYEVPEPHPPYGARGLAGEESGIGRHSSVTLTVRFGERERTLQWDSGMRVGPKYIEHWRRLWWVAEQMYYAVVIRPEYRALPKGRPHMIL